MKTREQLIEKLRKTRLYSIWANMLQRTGNPNNPSFKFYGAKGIVVCEKWKKFEGFISDMYDFYKPELTLDRINNNKGYSKDNCRWATWEQQYINKKKSKSFTFNGETKTLHEWAKSLGIPRGALYSRIYEYGWKIEEALSTPSLNFGKRRKEKIARGEQIGNSKLTVQKVLDIRKMGKNTSFYEIAKKFNISYGHVWCLVKRKSWTHIK